MSDATNSTSFNVNDLLQKAKNNFIVLPTMKQKFDLEKVKRKNLKIGMFMFEKYQENIVSLEKIRKKINTSPFITSQIDIRITLMECLLTDMGLKLKLLAR